MLLDYLLGIMICPRHHGTRFGGFGMCVGDERADNMAYLFFYRPVQPSAGYPVTIDDLLKPVRRNVVLVNPYNIPSECAKIILQTAVVKSHFLQAL